MLLVVLKTGLRQGELIGLQWSDVDLQRGKLHVRRTIWRGVTGWPQGGRERTVDLPASVVDALKGHRHLRGPYVFCQPDGQPLTDGLMKLPLQRALRGTKPAGAQRRIGPWAHRHHGAGEAHLLAAAEPHGVRKSH